jgi:serine protease inhibitor
MNYTTTNTTKAKSSTTFDLLAKHSNLYNDFIVSNLKDISYILSPYSIFNALSLLHMGSDKETFVELYELLFRESMNKKSHIKTQDLQQQILKIIETFNNINGHNNLNINIVNNFYINESYQKYLQDDYMIASKLFGNINTINFNDTIVAVNRINKDISDNTNKTIENIISSDDIDTTTKMVIVNCLYFKPDWKNKFVESITSNSLFIKHDDSTKYVMMMKNNQKTNYYENEELQYISLLYEHPDFTFDIILPKLSYDKNLNYSSVDMLRINQLSICEEVIVYLPRFEQTYDINIKDLLINNGVKYIFSDNANFSRMNKTNDIMVDNIKHRAVIKINETGTEAAAVTVIYKKKYKKSNKKIELKTFVANHTFKYFIRYKPTNLVLFTGQFNG